MSTAVMERMAAASPRLKARIAGLFWLLTIGAGAGAMFLRGGRWGLAASLAATACYVVATLLVYDLLQPVSRRVSLLAAFFSLVGCTVGTLDIFLPLPRNLPLLFFGLHCLLVGYLIFRSTFMPRFVGVLMAVGGLSWLGFGLVPLMSAPFARSVSPYLMAPGILGESVLTLWLLVVGVHVQRWQAQARAGGAGRSI